MATLTARFVDTVRKAGRYGDGQGLYLVVTPAGSRKWVLRFQHQRRRRDMGLGTFPAVTLAEARDRAISAKRQLAKGEDPIAERRRVRNERPIPTFAEVAAEVIEKEQAKSTNEKVRYQWSLLLGKAYCSTILNKPVDAITTRDIERLLRPVWTAKPETARKLHRRLRRVFDHARVRLRDEHGIATMENPAKWDDLKALGFTAPRKLSRGPQPALDYCVASTFLQALRSRATTSSYALELLLLTAVRTDAVRRAEWGEFDLEAAVWTIPVSHLKDRATRREPFRVPLAPHLVHRLRDWRERRVSPYLFSGPDESRPISNMAMLTFLKKINRDAEGQPIWRDPRDSRPIVPHGLRATFRTWAEEETHYPRAVMEEALGHQVGSAVERAYRRTDVLEKRRLLMAEWATFCGA